MLHAFAPQAQHNELRVTHAAAASLSTRLERLTEAISHRRSRTGSDRSNRLLTVAKEAARAAECAARESAAAEQAHRSLHAEAGRIVAQLTAELVEAKSQQLMLKAELLEAGSLLLSTHAALGTRLEDAPRLTRVRQARASGCLARRSEAGSTSTLTDIRAGDASVLRLRSRAGLALRHRTAAALNQGRSSA